VRVDRDAAGLHLLHAAAADDGGNGAANTCSVAPRSHVTLATAPAETMAEPPGSITDSSRVPLAATSTVVPELTIRWLRVRS